MAPQTAQPPLEFIPPRFTPWVCKAAQLATPAWLHWQTGVDGFDYEGLEQLVTLLEQFKQGQVRLLLAFRHPTADDPLCLMQLFGYDLPKAGRREGKALKGLSHFHFVYDRGIPLWAGDFVGWLYSRLGGVPIHRGRVDVQGLRSARNLLVNGQFPLAAAPEGATNGHGEIVSPIESGVSQLSVWAVQDLRKAERDETVLILPIGIRYQYKRSPWKAIDQLLGQLEQDCGLEGSWPRDLECDRLLPFQTDEATGHRYRRLYRLANHALMLMENHYRRYSSLSSSLAKPAQTGKAEASPAPEALFERLQRLLETALAVTEAAFSVMPKGSLANRCRRLEQAGWDRIYREDIGDLTQLSEVERGLADRVAAEAQMQLWHMRLVESFVAVTGRYVREKPTAERFAESALLLDKLFARLKGETQSRRSQLGRRQVKMRIGQPLSATEAYGAALAAGETSSRAGRKAVAELNQQLQQALECLTESN